MLRKALDGRNILYGVNLDANKDIAVDQGATQKRAAVLAAMPYTKTVPQPVSGVKSKSSRNSERTGDSVSNQTLAAQPAKNSDRQNKNRASSDSPLTRRSVKQRSVGSAHEKMSSTAAAGILSIPNIANEMESVKNTSATSM